jgi:protein-L-isoaspartate(D-aspartate) O-methyltransferase
MPRRLDYADARQLMVERQLVGRGVRNQALLKAMAEVPREMFVDAAIREFSYEDGPLPIACGQTISQPYVVAAMIEAAHLKNSDAVLEIGVGSGYAAAVVSRIAARVYAIERHADLAQAAAARLKALGYANIEARAGDGTLGWPEAAPFDAIIVSAAAPSIPAPLRDQLAIGGRLVIPVGPRAHQRLMQIVRRSEADFEAEDRGAVAFVPLIGAQGWRDACASADQGSSGTRDP